MYDNIEECNTFNYTKENKYCFKMQYVSDHGQHVWSWTHNHTPANLTISYPGFKQHFGTRYLVFYNPSPPRMFLSLDLLSEYRIQHGAIGPLSVTYSYSALIFCRGVSGFATDCPCDVWCRGLTNCLLRVGPPFRNRFLNNSWAVGLT